MFETNSARTEKEAASRYGRPKSSRNAFELIVEALKIWARKFEQASQWRVVSVGAPHRDIQLASNVALRSKGKVTLEEYGSYLADAAVGISLMVSPHPSYPPLEMAEYSVNVVTNSFANKDLAKRSSYIHTVFDVTPENLAEPLVRLCDAFDRSRASKVFRQEPERSWAVETSSHLSEILQQCLSSSQASRMIVVWPFNTASKRGSCASSAKFWGLLRPITPYDVRRLHRGV